METGKKYKTDGIFVNKNEKQKFFNEIKGSIHEKNDGADWCSITLNVGHESPRLVNLALKKAQFDVVDKEFELGDKVAVGFYLTSRFKNGRWYTVANALSVKPVESK